MPNPTPPGRRCLDRREFAVLLSTVLAISLAGCGNSEGFGTIDLDALRKQEIAEGKPDPLARPAQRDLKYTMTKTKKGGAAPVTPRH
jgi:hypothetical protein